MDLEKRLHNLERTMRLQRRLILMGALAVLAAVSVAFVGPLMPQDPEAFKVTTPNAGGTATTRLQVSGNENTAQAAFLNSNLGVGTSSQFGSGVGVVGIANAGTVPSTNPSSGGVLYAEAGQLKWRRSDGTIDVVGNVGTVDNSVSQGRLTLSSGNPLTTIDVTAATTVYFAPFYGNRIALYSGTAWSLYTFTERSLSLSGLSANTNFDIFIYDNSGTLTLESVAWTNNTTRATAIVLQDGVWVKSGAATRRYAGTIRTTATAGQCEDSETKRYVWNVSNRVARKIKRVETTSSWTYTVAAWRALNNSSANRMEFVIGIAEDPVVLMFDQRITLNAAGWNGAVGIGVDSTTSNSADVYVTMDQDYPGYTSIQRAQYASHPGLGYHYLQLLEYGYGSGWTNTLYGGGFSSGSIGWIWG
jgi:hypothetical protein